VALQVVVGARREGELVLAGIGKLAHAWHTGWHLVEPREATFLTRANRQARTASTVARDAGMPWSPSGNTASTF
jgi:hypothetical protein